MFTVRMRFPSGNENTFEVRRVEWIENDIPLTEEDDAKLIKLHKELELFNDDFTDADRTNIQTEIRSIKGRICRAGLMLHYEDGGCSHYAREDKGRGMQVWIMNRHGATVGSYHF